MGHFSEKQIQEAWEKVAIVGNGGSEWGKDPCGAWINKKQYGSESEYGWGIDHMYPLSKGGNNHPDNLMAMHWSNNRSKGDDYPAYYSATVSEGSKNIPLRKKFTIS